MEELISYNPHEKIPDFKFFINPQYLLNYYIKNQYGKIFLTKLSSLILKNNNVIGIRNVIYTTINNVSVLEYEPIEHYKISILNELKTIIKYTCEKFNHVRFYICGHFNIIIMIDMVVDSNIESMVEINDKIEVIAKPKQPFYITTSLLSDIEIDFLRDVFIIHSPDVKRA